MRPEEIRALGELAGDAAAGLATHVRAMHHGIARRAFAAVGPGAAGIRATHDRIAGGVYTATEGSLGLLMRAGARAISATRPADAPSLQRSAAGRIAVGALNGVVGDALSRRRSALALEMTLRHDGEELHAVPDATPRVALFIHGLCETDDAWSIGAARHVPYGARLRDELGWTPLYLRYNSGLHISENGRALAELLERLDAEWPVELTELTLIGHSMGGLVARSACHYGAERDWSTKVRHVFTLGAPHRGAPLEQAANAASAALALVPETRPFATALNRRSAGIKDLRYGYLVDECWVDQDCDAFLRNTARDVPFLRTANHYFICATLSRAPDAPVGRLIGDLLVLRSSAWDHGGRRERMRFPVEHYTHVGGANHFDLLNHRAIYEQIARRLDRRALEAAAAQRP